MSTERPRSPGILYAALALALLVFVTAIALTAQQPPPPTIAEFAPQAVENISDAPSDQSSTSGSGRGPGAAEARRAGVAPPPLPIDVPRVRRCVGDPPRQIEDPQSPPCVPYWQGDNGGATSDGITRDEIRVYIPTDTNIKSFFEDLRSFYNKRFEFYGRRLVFVYSSASNSATGASNVQGQQAEAQTAKSMHMFATNFYRAAGGYFYMQEATRLRLLNITGGLIPFSRDELASYHPYTWEYYMDADTEFANLGEWACGRLAGRNALYAGDASMHGKPRRFGIIQQTYNDSDPTRYDALTRTLAACGVKAAAEVRNGVRQDQGGEGSQAAAVDPATSSNVMLQMKQAGVTSVFCLCQLLTMGALMKAATNQTYFPEWLVSTYGGIDHNIVTTEGGWSPEQGGNAFGLTFQPRQLRPEREPYVWAAREVNPSYVDDGSSGSVGGRTQDYRALLVLVSGIQMAGPHLTPETFARVLWKTAFPNPDHPNMAGKVGFPENEHGMTIDGAEFWWQPGGIAPYTNQDAATACYVAGGARHERGRWPRGDPAFFNPPCDSGA